MSSCFIALTEEAENWIIAVMAANNIYAVLGKCVVCCGKTRVIFHPRRCSKRVRDDVGVRFANLFLER